MEAQLRLWTDDVDFVVAETPDEARRIVIERIGYGEDDVPPVLEWREVPPSDQFTIWEDHPGSGKRETRPVGEWIAAHGRGLLASTEA